MNAELDRITEEEILSANIMKYNDDKIVNFYVDFEEPKYLYYEYHVIFQAVLNVLSKYKGKRLRVVDVCGGAGKASFVIKKCNPWSEISLVDVSDKMLNIAKLKAKKLKVDLNIVNADAFSFLEKEGEYDLIIFSSAIHHFKDPCKLLYAASQKLSPNGLIITIADPTILIKSRRYRFFEFLIANKQGKKEILKRLFTSESEIKKSEWDIAEYQAITGINDVQLAEQLTKQGLVPLIHLRYPAGEPYMTKIMPLIGLNWAFSMILCSSNQKNKQEIKRYLRKEICANLPFRCNLM